MIVTGENGIIRRKTRASVTFPTTDPTWTGIGLNMVFRGERLPNYSSDFFLRRAF